VAATAVTPVGVRDGDPDALAGLCDRRGPAVLAYCEVVAGFGEIATAAAAAAFGSFRAGVVAAPDLANLNPEALLISATRHAAARYAGADAPEPHTRVPALLAARADRSITLADHDWLEEHLETCWTCRAPVARFEAADRAYRDPPTTRMEPPVSAAILAALVAAAPVPGAPEELPAVAEPSPNGSAPAYEHAAPEPEGYVDQPTAAWQAGAGGQEQVLETPVEPQAEAPAPQPDRAARRTVKIGGLSRRPRAASVPATAALGAEAELEPRSSRGASLPRPSRVAVEAGEGRRSRPALRRGLVLPIVLVVLAIVIALLIAGVFGGDEPASAPQSFAPDSGTPTETTPAPVVVVPGAADASAAAVEAAKAKTRAARRRAAEARKAAASSAATSATAGATPPIAPPPAAAAGDGAAAPAQKQAPADEEAKIDTGDGATGAEELPPSEDTSDIPQLTPPAETADPPGQ